MQRPISFSATARRQTEVRQLSQWILYFPVLCAALLGFLAYQLPARSTIRIGDPGDRLFLSASEALDAGPAQRGQWYADELGDEGRSRWTRSRARLSLPGLVPGTTEIVLRVQGWPDDVHEQRVQQPTVRVHLLGGNDQDVVLGQFTPVSSWQDYPITIPNTVQISAKMALELVVSDTFTTSGLFADDVRPKGIRVDRLTVDSAGGWRPFVIVWPTIWLFAGMVGFGMLAIRRRASSRVTLVCGIGLVILGTLALILWRPWATLLMPSAAGLTGAALIATASGTIWRWARAAMTRLRMGDTLAVGGISAMVVIALLLIVSQLHQLSLPSFAQVRSGPDTFIGMLPTILLSVLFVLAGPTLLPPLLRGLQRRLVAGWTTPIFLALIAGALLGWEASLLRSVPIVGHADYADNAVVARNLLRGEGWRVPYVTQFYQAVADGSVYRPQETWPLLQPLLIAPFMALFGPNAFGARIGNIVFNSVLVLEIYFIGTNLWDRRVGALVALLTLTNLLFFRLTIYATSDLALVVWSIAAFWLVFRAVEIDTEMSASGRHVRFLARTRVWAAAGLFTGLMILQKPSAAILACCMGLWIMWQARRIVPGMRWWKLATSWHFWTPLLIWTGVTLVILAPYLVRNFRVFGRPFFSTESFDAWILYFRGTGKGAWEDIYRVYAPAFGGGGVPDRSWILRWGFDRTFAKIVVQVREAWTFFAPPRGELLGIAGTWLMILGLPVLGPRRRRLFGLLGLALAAYIAFLCLYWHTHDEPRYFVAWVPWMLMIAVGGLCYGFDRVLQYRRGIWSGLVGALAVIWIGAILYGQVRSIDGFLDPQRGSYWGRDWKPDLQAYDWLQHNTQPDDVIMTRVPWQLSFETDRPSLMIPNAPLTSDDAKVPTIMQIARYYGADYLVVNMMTGPGGQASQTLRPLSEGKAIMGFERVYAGTQLFNRKPVYIYRFPADYAGAQPVQP